MRYHDIEGSDARLILHTSRDSDYRTKVDQLDPIRLRIHGLRDHSLSQSPTSIHSHGMAQPLIRPQAEMARYISWVA